MTKQVSVYAFTVSWYNFSRYMKIKSSVGRKQIAIRFAVVTVIISAVAGIALYGFFVISSMNSCTATYIRHSDGQTSQMGCG